MKRQIIIPMCFVIVALIVMHSLSAGGGNPMRRDRRAPERRIAQVRVLRRAESVELHS